VSDFDPVDFSWNPGALTLEQKAEAWDRLVLELVRAAGQANKIAPGAQGEEEADEDYAARVDKYKHRHWRNAVGFIAAHLRETGSPHPALESLAAELVNGSLGATPSSALMGRRKSPKGRPGPGIAELTKHAVCVAAVRRLQSLGLPASRAQGRLHSWTGFSGKSIERWCLEEQVISIADAFTPQILNMEEGSLKAWVKKVIA